MIYGHKNIIGEFIIFYDKNECKNGKVLSCWSHEESLILLIVDFDGNAHVRNVIEIKMNKKDFLNNKL